MLRIRLPFPDRKLNPNRSHGKAWQATRAPRKAANDAGYFAAMDDCHARGTGSASSIGLNKAKPLRLRIAIHPPDNRRRDLDNIISALKPYQDGVFAYIPFDDSQITRKEVVMRRSCPGGKVYYILYQKNSCATGIAGVKQNWTNKVRQSA